MCRLQIDLKGMTSRVTYITLESLPTKTGRRTIIYNLNGQFRRNSSSYDGTVGLSLCRSVLFVQILEPYFRKIDAPIINFHRQFFYFQASGVIKNIRAKNIALLLAGRLFINVATERKSSQSLRGRIESIEHSDYINYANGMYHRRNSCKIINKLINICNSFVINIFVVFFKLDVPFLMTSLPTSPTGVGGVAWLVPDRKCRLHYQIILSGLQDYSSLNALLVGEFDSTATQKNKNAIYTLVIHNFINGMVRPQ